MIPFAQRVTCTIQEACAYSGLGRSTIYEAIKDGRLDSTNVRVKPNSRGRRLVSVPSLLKFVGAQVSPLAAELISLDDLEIVP